MKIPIFYFNLPPVYQQQDQCCIAIIAVYIDSLVMISIEKSETNKKEHWKSETNLSQTMNFVTDWANAKSMPKIRYKFHGLRQIKKPFKSN